MLQQQQVRQKFQTVFIDFYVVCMHKVNASENIHRFKVARYTIFEMAIAIVLILPGGQIQHTECASKNIATKRFD